MKKKSILIALVVVLLLSGLALWFGLRGNSGTRASAPEVTIYAPEGTTVIVMPASEKTEPTGKELADNAVTYEITDSDKLELDLKNGEYSILASRGDDYNPWMKEITVSVGTATDLYPFFFLKKPVLERTDDPKVLSAFATPATLPTEAKPRVNSDKTAELYVSKGIAFIHWTGEVKDMPEFFCPGENVDDCLLQPVFNFGTLRVENLEFYGKHDELMIADLGQIIVAIEIDRRGTQNRQPVYTGKGPVAFRIIDGTIYVSEAGVASKVVLE